MKKKTDKHREGSYLYSFLFYKQQYSNICISLQDEVRKRKKYSCAPRKSNAQHITVDRVKDKSTVRSENENCIISLGKERTKINVQMKILCSVRHHDHDHQRQKTNRFNSYIIIHMQVNRRIIPLNVLLVLVVSCMVQYCNCWITTETKRSSSSSLSSSLLKFRPTATKITSRRSNIGFKSIFYDSKSKRMMISSKIIDTSTTTTAAAAFVAMTPSSSTLPQNVQQQQQDQEQQQQSVLSTIAQCNNVTLEYYNHNNEYSISYQYKPASVGYENQSPLLLIHPIGIGMSSWFWNKLIESSSSLSLSTGHPAIYAVNLIGCGKQQNSTMLQIPSTTTTTNTQQQQQFSASDASFESNVPLLWVQQCETLINTVILPRLNNNNINNNIRKSTPISSEKRSNPLSKMLQFFPRKKVDNNDRIDNVGSADSTTPTGVTVVTQGGLAPIGVMLAARNNINIIVNNTTTSSAVSRLVLLSPPTYKELITSVPINEIQNNYNFLSSKFFGTLAFQLLESSWAIEFFSNLFLFSSLSSSSTATTTSTNSKSSKCDNEWITYAINEATSCDNVRIPVQIFNSGYCLQKSLQNELTKKIQQPTVIIQGSEDTIRNSNRNDYLTNMMNCQLKIIQNGKNVLPWENPQQLWNILQEYYI